MKQYRFAARAMERVRWSSAPELELLEGFIGTREQVIACLRLQAASRRMLGRRKLVSTLESVDLPSSLSTTPPAEAEVLSLDATQAFAAVIGADDASPTVLGGASAASSSACILDTATVNGVAGPFVNTWPRPVEVEDQNISLKMMFFHRSDRTPEIS